MRLFWLFSVISCLALTGQALTPSSFFSTVDKERLRSVFKEGLASTDLPSLHYAVLGYKLLGETAPKSADLCKTLQQKLGGSLAEIYQAAYAGQALKCQLKPSDEVTKALKTALSAADSTAQDLHNAALAQAALGVKVDGAAVIKSLQAALKKDDSLTNLGYAFRAASAVDGGDAKTIFDRVEDAVVQADEVDGKMLQFEGGLSVTNLILSGAYDLSAKLGKTPPISKMQSAKFANYFLSRKSVQTVKGGVSLLEAFTTLTTNKFHIPVAVTLQSSSAVVSEATPKVTVRVTDLFGKALAGKLDVAVESAMRQSDGAVIMSKKKMAAVGSEGSDFEVNVMEAKPGRGFYELTVNAVPAKADERLVGNTGALLLVKALGSVVVSSAEIGVVDADQSTAPKLSPVVHPKKLGSVLEADHHHKVVFKFALKDKTSGDKIKAHQAFVRMVHAKSGQEIIFVAEPDSNLVYKFDLDLSTRGKDFGGRSGKYEVELIVGDAVISNPLSWPVADINLKFAEAAEESDDSASAGPKPEITHMFRQPDSRPPATVSLVFTGLCLVPFLFMLIGWARIGVNVSAFPFSLTAIGFHVGLGAIFALYYYFWLQLDMFTTVKYLMMVGVVTFLCGNSLLVRIAEKRKQ